jgi:hypothetical protein
LLQVPAENGQPVAARHLGQHSGYGDFSTVFIGISGDVPKIPLRRMVGYEEDPFEKKR